ncbi:phosphotransferase family protein, partial [Mycolicibacterium elephantis]
MSEKLTAALAEVLEPLLGAGVVVENLRRLTGGASRT